LLKIKPTVIRALLPSLSLTSRFSRSRKLSIKVGALPPWSSELKFSLHSMNTHFQNVFITSVTPEETHSYDFKIKSRAVNFVLWPQNFFTIEKESLYFFDTVVLQK